MSEVALTALSAQKTQFNNIRSGLASAINSDANIPVAITDGAGTTKLITVK